MLQRLSPRPGAYVASVALLSLANVSLLALGGWLSGIRLDHLDAGDPAVVFLHIGAFSALLFPSLSVAIRRIAERRSANGWGLPVYALAVACFMIAFFGKPLAISISPLVPGVMLMVLAAWLVVEMLDVVPPPVPATAHPAAEADRLSPLAA